MSTVTTETLVSPRHFLCRCGRPVFFRNSTCLACGTPLGYEPGLRQVLPLEPAGLPVDAEHPPRWRALGTGLHTPALYRCAQLDTEVGCNWLVDAEDATADAAEPGQAPLCRSCRLTRTRPDLGPAEHATWWQRIEQAKRQLVATLIALDLPVASRAEDPARGLAFDLMRAPPEGPPVVTGHADGVITLDIEEADDARREERRQSLGEPYRTLLGHLRHESGHYYWQRLVAEGEWLTAFREIFGDEREDYAAALQRHYAQGAPADWGTRFVTAYASSHPWEDWSETWAHYLHLVDTRDAARSFGLDGSRVGLHYEHFGTGALGEGVPEAEASEFLHLIHDWMELTGVLNELSRSMGMPDFYPFVLSAPVVRKLHLVHRVIRSPRADHA